MKWITREKARVDRIACPWLIRRFIDPDAEFLFVPAAEVTAVAVREEAIPFDVPGAELGHRGEQCSFDALIERYRLGDPALAVLAPIVRGADTEARYLTPESPGLYALASGFRAASGDDHENMRLQFPAYDALYAHCQALVAAASAPPSRAAVEEPERVARWRAAWESRDVERIVGLYEPGATHASALVPRLYPEAGGDTLHGTAAIAEYARRGLSRFTVLRFELLSVTESVVRSAVEYLRHSNVDPSPTTVLELIEWNGARIRAVRVFH